MELLGSWLGLLGLELWVRLRISVQVMVRVKYGGLMFAISRGAGVGGNVHTHSYSVLERA